MKKRLLTAVLVIAAVITVLVMLPPDLSYRGSRQPMPSHYTDSGYTNPWPDDRHLGRFRDLMKIFFNRSKTRPKYKTAHNSLPVDEPNWAAINNPADDMVITWIGHASFLVQIGGQNILTDPNLSDRASPVSFAGPRRLTRPGIAIDSLPQIDAVVISHNHYDHLDKRTVLALGNGPKWYVPLGLKKWFNNRGITNVVELDWWESDNLTDQVAITCTPAKHFSARTMWNRDETLWSSWLVEAAGKKIFFAGDTAYGPHFGEIGERFGPVDVSLLPIGAYSPRWFMSPMHVDPEEAIKAHLDLQSTQSIAMHWGTFLLTDEALNEPPTEFRQFAEKAGLSEDEAIIVRHGQTTIFP